jgi:hypothetical protein
MEYISTLKLMFDDMKHSATFSESFHERYSQSLMSSFDFHPFVLAHCVWFRSSPPPKACGKIPAELQSYMEIFEGFYRERHKHRRIVWRSEQSNVVFAFHTNSSLQTGLAKRIRGTFWQYLVLSSFTADSKVSLVLISRYFQSSRLRFFESIFYFYDWFAILI